MKKALSLIILSLLAVGCANKQLPKASLEYKIMPTNQVSAYKYDFNLAIPKVIDKRTAKFVLNSDNYFDGYIMDSIQNLLFEEMRTSNSFNTLDIVKDKIAFSPKSSELQEIKRTTGQDAVLLTQVNKFNINAHKLSDSDESNFVKLNMFANITYKIILTDSETVIFLTTVDTSNSKIIELNDNIYKSINQMAINSLKENISQVKNEFMETTKIMTKDQNLKPINTVNTLNIN